MAQQYTNYLKVKVLSLQDEARIIRREEEKRRQNAKKSLEHNHPETAEYHEKVRQGLQQHRVIDVREEARNALLAYGFLRGNQYRDMEYRSSSQPDWARVKKLALRYGEGDKDLLELNFAQWLGSAQEDWIAGWAELETKRDLRIAKRKARKAMRDATILDSV